MDAQTIYSSDVAFTPTVKAIQTRKGSRRGYAHKEEEGAWPTVIRDDLKSFIEAQTSVFLATANAAGPAHHPASRRPGRLPQGARREDHRLRRLRRQPAIHHDAEISKRTRRRFCS